MYQNVCFFFNNGGCKHERTGTKCDYDHVELPFCDKEENNQNCVIPRCQYKHTFSHNRYRRRNESRNEEYFPQNNWEYERNSDDSRRHHNSYRENDRFRGRERRDYRDQASSSRSTRYSASDQVEPPPTSSNSRRNPNHIPIDAGVELPSKNKTVKNWEDSLVQWPARESDRVSAPNRNNVQHEYKNRNRPHIRDKESHKDNLEGSRRRSEDDSIQYKNYKNNKGHRRLTSNDYGTRETNSDLRRPSSTSETYHRINSPTARKRPYSKLRDPEKGSLINSSSDSVKIESLETPGEKGSDEYHESSNCVLSCEDELEFQSNNTNADEAKYPTNFSNDSISIEHQGDRVKQAVDDLEILIKTCKHCKAKYISYKEKEDMNLCDTCKTTTNINDLESEVSTDLKNNTAEYSLGADSQESSKTDVITEFVDEKMCINSNTVLQNEICVSHKNDSEPSVSVNRDDQASLLNDVLQWLKCGFCGKKYLKKDSLLNHIMSHKWKELEEQMYRTYNYKTPDVKGQFYCRFFLSEDCPLGTDQRHRISLLRHYGRPSTHNLLVELGICTKEDLMGECCSRPSTPTDPRNSEVTRPDDHNITVEHLPEDLVQKLDVRMEDRAKYHSENISQPLSSSNVKDNVQANSESASNHLNDDLDQYDYDSKEKNGEECKTGALEEYPPAIKLKKRIESFLTNLAEQEFEGTFKEIQDMNVNLPVECNLGPQLHISNSTKTPYRNSNSTKQYHLYDKQKEVATRTLDLMLKSSSSKICDFTKFEWYILMPYYRSLSDQMVARVKDWISTVRSKGKTNDMDFSHFMKNIQPNDSRSYIHDHIIRMGTGAKDQGGKTKSKNENEKFKDMIRKITKNSRTLYIVVVDEAHFGINEDSEFSSFFNQPNFDKIFANVIVLQVSATPYTMVTQYSRIPESNVVNWFLDDEDEGDYYGIKSYYQTATSDSPHVHNKKLLPGALVVDTEYESMVNSVSEKWSRISQMVDHHFQEELGKEKSSVYESYKETAIENIMRQTCMTAQYMQGMMKTLKTYPEEQLKILFEGDKLFTSWKLSDLSENIFKTITNVKSTTCYDKVDDTRQVMLPEKGKMCLVRHNCKKEAQFFHRILCKLRKILQLQTAISIVIDIDDDSNMLGIKRFNDNESIFAERIKSWKKNPNFKPECYSDLSNIPVLLIVVDKGKMGITYPDSLQVYDLRLRYTTSSNMKRTPFEQDLGRVCRYKSKDAESKPLATVVISSACNDIIARNNSGVYSDSCNALLPHYPDKMLSGKKNHESCPKNDNDLDHYQRYWLPGRKNMDSNNSTKEKFANRFLLFGKPQVGKTGCFLHLIELLWFHIELQSSLESNGCSDIIVDSDIEDEEQAEDNEKEDGEIYSGEKEDENVVKNNLDKYLDPLNAFPFPPFDKLKRLPLRPKFPPPSTRYGDPSIQEDRDHYLIHGKTYPPERLLKLQQNNSLLDRINSETSTNSESSGSEPGPSGILKLYDENNKRCKTFRTDFTKYGSRRLVHPKEEKYRDLHDYRGKYNSYELPFGMLYLNKEMERDKWNITEDSCPSMNTSIAILPIVICSSGRADTGLFDLRQAMEGENDYIQILVIREEEQDEYFSLTQYHSNIDIFVIPRDVPHKIGASRKYAKNMSEKIFGGCVFLMDDNIRGWSLVSFNTEYSPVTTPKTGLDTGTARDEDISLLTLLQLFNKYSGEMEKFSLIGFQFSKRGIRTCKQAFSRKHVYGAVVLNLKKTARINYSDSWAMEDIDFNSRINECWKVDNNDGVIVKFQNIIASKKTIKTGGVVPYDMPPNIERLMNQSEEWRYFKTACPLQNVELSKMGDINIENDLTTYIKPTTKKRSTDQVPDYSDESKKRRVDSHQKEGISQYKASTQNEVCTKNKVTVVEKESQALSSPEQQLSEGEERSTIEDERVLPVAVDDKQKWQSFMRKDEQDINTSIEFNQQLAYSTAQVDEKLRAIEQKHLEDMENLKRALEEQHRSEITKEVDKLKQKHDKVIREKKTIIKNLVETLAMLTRGRNQDEYE